MDAAATNPEVAFDSDRHVLLFTHTCDYGPDSLPEYQHEQVTARLPIGVNGWRVVQSDPLTVTPSVLCLVCRLHGLWQSGKWVAL